MLMLPAGSGLGVPLRVPGPVGGRPIPHQKKYPMKLEKSIELLHRSSQRMLDSLSLTRDAHWWTFLRREIWIHFKRTLQVWWAITRKDDRD